MYACSCRGLTEAAVRRAGRDGARTPDALIHRFGLDAEGCCGRCLAHVENFVALAWEGVLDDEASRSGYPRKPLAA